MKKITLLLLFLFFQITIKAQNFQLSPRVGYDFLTMYDNSTPYIDYKGGLNYGISADYYWSWYGLGIDVDYITNQPKSTYPTENLYTNKGILLDKFSLTEDKINRLFYGIGPDFRFQNVNKNFSVELNTRIGFANIKGGKVLLKGNSATKILKPKLLNFFADYDVKNTLSFKGQLRFNYFFTDNLGVNLGVYYMNHFKTQNQKDATEKYSASYIPFEELKGQNVLSAKTENMYIEEPCNCGISSVGASLGLVYRFGTSRRIKTDNYTQEIIITTKDKFTDKALPNTDVVLTDLKGNIVKTATTNSFGIVNFKGLKQDDYLVKAKLNEIDLSNSNITKDEFKNAEKTKSEIKKVLLYTDENFILKGQVLECNSTNGIENVEVILKNKTVGQKMTTSNLKGNFKFHLKQKSAYTLRGHKQGYFSNEITVKTSDFNRKETLFIDFEMCVDPCGKAIELENINFDLNKSEILPKAKTDLDYVVKLMKSNPKIKVEMSSHTDSRASHKYNQELSLKRAKATVDYLVSKGISRGRLISRGAGETELLNHCSDNVKCSEKEHAINRRTEFKIVCPK